MKVHVGKIDEQHKKLISIMKSLHDALQSDKAGEAEKEILVELIKYTDYHFSLEKDLMKKHDYPQMDEHLALHREFTDKLKEFCTKHQAGDSDVSRDVLAFLVRWLINHIMNIDKKLGVFLNQQGIN
jgi:hemerythrin-like metal-binding protein